MTYTIPRWALERACAAIGRKLHHYDRMGEENILRQSIEAHALVIAEHEEPPAGKIVGTLYWETPDGVLRELKRVSGKEFAENLLPIVNGIPTVFAVWPEPEGI